MREFKKVWDDFKAGRRLEHGGHTDPEWRGDHTLSAAFVIPVEAEDFAGTLRPLKDALRPFPFVSLHPDYFMHISLVLVGFVDNAPENPDEFSEEKLEGLAQSAKDALSGFGEFGVRLANLGAFPAAAYVEAHDGNGEIDALRETLLIGCGLESKTGPPHLTLAYFRAEDGTEAPGDLIDAIEPYRDWPVGEFTVRSVDLTVLDLRSEYARPQTYARLPLR